MDDHAGMSAPSGTVTFLFTDVEGSTETWERSPNAMRTALERHDEIVRSAVDRHAGHVFATGGDGFCVAFARVEQAIGAAIAAQRDLTAQPWAEETQIRVRIGLHTGEAHERGGDYFGPAVNRAARIMACAHGGQVVCSAATALLARPLLPPAYRSIELGTVALKGLSTPETVFGILGPGLGDRFPPLRTSTATVGNLPSSQPGLIGRSAEVELLASLVLERGIVTVTGPGGVGKTRLALAVADLVADKFPDGAWLVELASVLTPSEVHSMVAASLAVREQVGQPVLETMAVALTSQRMLVVLDNCEHLLDQVPLLVERLRRSCPTVTFLATSRERLGLHDEHEVVLSPLGCAGSRSPAVELFLERSTRPELASEPLEMTSVAEICERLEGLPFAIELAAARCRAMTPSAVAERLRESSRLLVDRRARDPRRATLSGLVQWSYDLLPPLEQQVFARLGVFVGGFDLRAAEAVAGLNDLPAADVEDSVVSLVEKSLIAHSQGRYRLLETTREFALGRLEGAGETEHVMRAHSAHYSRWAELAADGLQSVDEIAWVEQMDKEWPNVNAAFRKALDIGDLDVAGAIASALDYERILRRSEAGGWATEVLETCRSIGRTPTTRLLEAAAYEAFFLRASVEETIALAHEAAARADASSRSSQGLALALGVGFDESAAGHAIEGIRLAERSGGDLVLASAVVVAAGVGSTGSEPPLVAASACATELLQGRDLGPTSRSYCQLALATAAQRAGETATAARLCRSAILEAERGRNLFAASSAWVFLGYSVELEFYEAARVVVDLARAGLTGLLWGAVVHAGTPIRASDAENALRLFGVVPDGFQGFGVLNWSEMNADLDARVGETRAAELRAEGRSLGLPGAIRLVRRLLDEA